MPEETVERREQMFPRLAPQQIARLIDLGKRRQMQRGEILYDQGAAAPYFYVVLSGALEPLDKPKASSLPPWHVPSEVHPRALPLPRLG